MIKDNHLQEYSIPFAAWELRLYLDTHPYDERALSLYHQLCDSQPKCSYACHTNNKQPRFNDHMYRNSECGCGFSGINHNEERKVWTWIDDPWPWELEANMIGGC